MGLGAIWAVSWLLSSTGAILVLHRHPDTRQLRGQNTAHVPFITETHELQATSAMCEVCTGGFRLNRRTLKHTKEWGVFNICVDEIRQSADPARS